VSVWVIVLILLALLAVEIRDGMRKAKLVGDLRLVLALQRATALSQSESREDLAQLVGQLETLAARHQVVLERFESIELKGYVVGERGEVGDCQGSS